MHDIVVIVFSLEVDIKKFIVFVFVSKVIYACQEINLISTPSFFILKKAQFLMDFLSFCT